MYINVAAGLGKICWRWKHHFSTVARILGGDQQGPDFIIGAWPGLGYSRPVQA